MRFVDATRTTPARALVRWLWLTTNPNPRAPAYGPDAGQRGWRLHAVLVDPTDRPEDIRYRRAACGARAAHGWGLDMFVNIPCLRCSRAVGECPDG